MELANNKNAQGYSARPGPGQLVEVCRRQWVVADMASSTLGSNTSPQNGVTLSSIDEDGLGEALEVIWEIKLCATIIERAGLPSITGQDDSAVLEAFLDAVRWGAATNADRDFLQAPFRSGVSIEDFQLDPLVRAIDMARVNLLIADDVGLGKGKRLGLALKLAEEMMNRLRDLNIARSQRELSGKTPTRRPLRDMDRIAMPSPQPNETYDLFSNDLEDYE